MMLCGAAKTLNYVHLILANAQSTTTAAECHCHWMRLDFDLPFPPLSSSLLSPSPLSLFSIWPIYCSITIWTLLTTTTTDTPTKPQSAFNRPSMHYWWLTRSLVPFFPHSLSRTVHCHNVLVYHRWYYRRTIISLLLRQSLHTAIDHGDLHDHDYDHQIMPGALTLSVAPLALHACFTLMHYPCTKFHLPIWSNLFLPSLLFTLYSLNHLFCPFFTVITVDCLPACLPAFDFVHACVFSIFDYFWLQRPPSSTTLLYSAAINNGTAFIHFNSLHLSFKSLTLTTHHHPLNFDHCQSNQIQSKCSIAASHNRRLPFL